MSAPSSSDGSKCEPDLTALLDLVLQMVMFFMLVTNLIVNELDPSVKLPLSVTARGLRETEGRLVFINVPYQKTASGRKAEQVYEVTIGNKSTPYYSPKDLEKALRNRYETDRVRAEKTGKITQFESQGEGLSTIIIRADENLDWQIVREVQQAISAAGYRKVHNRVLKPS